MGIELERFVNDIEDELKCTICCGVLENAVQISECEHTFCSNCIQEWIGRQSTCPIDRREITSDDIKPPSRLLNSFLNRLNIKCDFNEFGCNAIIALETLESHLNHCNFNPEKAFPCEKGCGILLTIKQKSDHNCVLEDILITIENQNEKIKKLEKLLEKDNAVIRKKIEVLEKKCQLIDSLEIQFRNLEIKYEQLVSKVSHFNPNSCPNNLSVEENNTNSFNVDNKEDEEINVQPIKKRIIDSKESIIKTITIEMDHKLKTIQLWANIYEPIINIKSRISEKENLAIQSQCLFYGDQLLCDDKTLNDYSITSWHFMLVKRPIKIDIIIFAENISLLLEPFETIGSIKERLHKLRGLSVSLSYFGQVLEDNKTLYSYKIRDRAKIKVTSIDCNRDKGRKSLPKINL